MENEEKEGEQPPQEEAAKSGLAKEWRKLATWQKAGVVIGGLGLVAGVIYFMNRQAAPTSTGNDQTGAMAPGFTGSPNSAYEGYPGAGDQYPPLPVSQPTGGPTSSPNPTPVSPAPIAPTPPGSNPPVVRPLPMLPGPVSGPIQPRQVMTAMPAPSNAQLVSASNTAAAYMANPFRFGTPTGRKPVTYSAPARVTPRAAAAPKAPAYTPAKSAALQRAIFNR